MVKRGGTAASGAGAAGIVIIRYQTKYLKSHKTFVLLHPTQSFFDDFYRSGKDAW